MSQVAEASGVGDLVTNEELTSFGISTSTAPAAHTPPDPFALESMRSASASRMARHSRHGLSVPKPGCSGDAWTSLGVGPRFSVVGFLAQMPLPMTSKKEK